MRGTASVSTMFCVFLHSQVVEVTLKVAMSLTQRKFCPHMVSTELTLTEVVFRLSDSLSRE